MNYQRKYLKYKAKYMEAKKEELSFMHHGGVLNEEQKALIEEVKNDPTINSVLRVRLIRLIMEGTRREEIVEIISKEMLITEEAAEAAEAAEKASTRKENATASNRKRENAIAPKQAEEETSGAEAGESRYPSQWASEWGSMYVTPDENSTSREKIKQTQMEVSAMRERLRVMEQQKKEKVAEAERRRVEAEAERRRDEAEAEEEQRRVEAEAERSRVASEQRRTAEAERRRVEAEAERRRLASEQRRTAEAERIRLVNAEIDALERRNTALLNGMNDLGKGYRGCLNSHLLNAPQNQKECTDSGCKWNADNENCDNTYLGSFLGSFSGDKNTKYITAREEILRNKNSLRSLRERLRPQ